MPALLRDFGQLGPRWVALRRRWRWYGTVRFIAASLLLDLDVENRFCGVASRFFALPTIRKRLNLCLVWVHDVRCRRYIELGPCAPSCPSATAAADLWAWRAGHIATPPRASRGVQQGAPESVLAPQIYAQRSSQCPSPGAWPRAHHRTCPRPSCGIARPYCSFAVPRRCRSLGWTSSRARVWLAGAVGRFRDNFALHSFLIGGR